MNDLFAGRRAGVEFQHKVAAVVRHRLYQIGVTEAMLERYLDYETPSDVARRLDGIDPWSVRDVHRIAALLDVPVSELLREAALWPRTSDS